MRYIGMGISVLDACSRFRGLPRVRATPLYWSTSRDDPRIDTIRWLRFWLGVSVSPSERLQHPREAPCWPIFKREYSGRSSDDLRARHQPVSPSLAHRGQEPEGLLGADGGVRDRGDLRAGKVRRAFEAMGRARGEPSIASRPRTPPRSPDHLGDLLRDAVFDVNGPEHLRDVDRDEQLREEQDLNGGDREVLDKLSYADVDGEVVRVAG